MMLPRLKRRRESVRKQGEKGRGRKRGKRAADLCSMVAAMSFISTMENCVDFLRDASAAQNVSAQYTTNAFQSIESSAAGGAGGQLTVAGCLLRRRG